MKKQSSCIPMGHAVGIPAMKIPEQNGRQVNETIDDDLDLA